MLQKRDYELQVLRYIQDVRKDHPTMGVRDLYFKIRPGGMGRDAFEAFCREKSLMSRKVRNFRKTTDSSGVIRFDNLLENTRIQRINQAWQSDISYFEVNGRFYYLTFIIDSYSRRIVGHSTSKSLHTVNTTLPALTRATKVRAGVNLERLILHSDGGGQYFAKEFLKVTNRLKIANSMCEYAWENGKAERINGVIKNNYLIHRKISSYEDLVKEVDRAVYLYNFEKPHIALKRIAPVTFEKYIATLEGQTKPKMTESFDEEIRSSGALSPLKSGQTKPQNQDVFFAENLEMSH